MDINILRNALQAHVDVEQSKKMSAYMRDQFKYFGVPATLRREVSREFLKSDKKSDDLDWDFVFECFDVDQREFQYIAMDYLDRHKAQLQLDDIEKLKRLIQTKSWWDTVDCLDSMVGVIVLKHPEAVDIMLKWSVDDDFWLRRVAIDHQMKFKNKTNTEVLSKVIINNFFQTEFFINKAIGWSLRECSKHNPEWVAEFLKEHKDNLSKLSYREASKRM